ncbi:hypothetical protein [Sphingomonas sp. PWP1-2]|uniref:hypothetical protein n=1 Tax=Sphingomonas sp. PWP1-2 TaxID=2804558 RepID=UPI003CF66755
MFKQVDFSMPPPHPMACVDHEAGVAPPPFDLLVSLLPPLYRAGVHALVDAGFIDAYVAGGRHWIKRVDLEDWLSDDGHTTYDPADPAYIALSISNDT